MSNAQVTVLSQPSTPLTFKVARSPVVVTPTIDSVKDDKGNDVSSNSSTVSTTLTLAGKALIGQQVEIRNGNDLLATVTADASGDWNSQLKSLSVKAYALKAHGVYGSNPASDAWNVTVVVAVIPVITSVIDDKGNPVPNGSSVKSRSLILSGTASAGQQVQIVDVNNLLKIEVVQGDGSWTSRLTGLALKTYVLKTKAMYGTHPESDVWTVKQHMGTEDLSNAPLGRHPDQEWVALSPVLSIRGALGGKKNVSAMLEIIQVGSGRELKWNDGIDHGEGSHELLLCLTGLESPLMYPLRVTLDFYFTEYGSKPRFVRETFYQNQTGQERKEITQFDQTAGTMFMTFPAGARFTHSHHGPGFIVRISRVGDTLSFTGHLKSISFS